MSTEILSEFEQINFEEKVILPKENKFFPKKHIGRQKSFDNLSTLISCLQKLRLLKDDKFFPA